MTATDTSPSARLVAGVPAQIAAGSSFYLPMRLMPKSEREAMFAIYAFCRAVDDIADDGAGPRAERHVALQHWREDLDSLYAGHAPARAGFLAPAVRRFALRREDFLAVIDGMEMDVADDIRAPELDVLRLYCDRVACAVGRLSVKVFGMEEEPGFALSHHLGQALQLTNILRDLDEDAALGRLYLPRVILEQAEIANRDPKKVIADSRVDVACRAVSALAHIHYDEAGRILAAKPKGLLRTPRIMRDVYGRILKKMESQGWAPPRQRARIAKAQLVFILLRSGFSG